LDEQERVRREGDQLQDLEERLLAKQREWGQHLQEWEGRDRAHQHDLAGRDAEIRQLRIQTQVQQRHTRQLREELERLAQSLMDGEARPTRSQAA
ncbi:MAG: hypothetical protein ACKO23_14750, partial [Gemmataceae bacterium]